LLFELGAEVQPFLPQFSQNPISAKKSKKKMAPISQLLSAILAPLILLFSRATAITLTGRRDLTSMDMSSANPAAVMAAGTNGVKGATVPQIQWGSNATHIEVQLTYPTTGWLALGLSPTGGMDQSDVLFGYVDDRTGEIVIQVRHERSSETPQWTVSQSSD
jgi:hypothetical protein